MADAFPIFNVNFSTSDARVDAGVDFEFLGESHAAIEGHDLIEDFSFQGPHAGLGVAKFYAEEFLEKPRAE